MRPQSAGGREQAELALDFAPSELVVEREPLGEQQRHLEALTRHRLDTEPHQRRRNLLMPILLQGEDRSDSSHRHRLSIKIDSAIENLDGRDQPPAIACDETKLIAKPRIVLIVSREKLPPIAVPMPQQ